MADSSYGAKQATSPDVTFRTDLAGGVHTPYHKDADRAALLSAISPLATQSTLSGVDTKLASILSTLQAQQDIAVSLWTDNTNAYFVRRDVIDQDSGVVTVTWTNSTGTAATPGAGLRPVNNEESLQTVSSRYQATNTGTGYTTGDLLERAVVLDLNTVPATVVSAVWVNITTGAVISAPTGGHYTAAPTGLPAGAATEVTLAAILAKLIASPATEATLAAMSAKLPLSLGVKADTGSLSVAASTQDIARFGNTTDSAALVGANGSLIAIAKALRDYASAIATAAADTTTPVNVVSYLNGTALITPVVSATPDYADGEAVGPVTQIVGALRGTGLSAYAMGGKAFAKVAASNMPGGFDVWVFNANPSASTFTDNAAVVLADADRAKLRGVISFGTFKNAGTTSSVATGEAREAITGAAGADVWVAIVARGALNLATTGDIALHLAFDQN